MGLRPKRIFNRLNRAKLDSTALIVKKGALLSAYRLVKKAHASWIDGGEPRSLVEASQQFVDLLSETFLVSPKGLTLVDKRRPHSRDSKGRVRGELYGSVSTTGNIRIYLRTPAREQPTAFKTYFNTLVHEWVHHYDFDALGDTVHCAGFYDRVNAIYKLCLADQDREESALR